MVLTNLNAEARFSGPQLIFTSFSGATAGGGSVDGRGSVTFSGGQTLLDLAFNANQRAAAQPRRYLARTVTGPGHHPLRRQWRDHRGRPEARRRPLPARPGKPPHRSRSSRCADTGLAPEEVIETADLQPWRLDVKVAGGGLRVEGLGINSRWTTALQIGGTADSPRFTGRADLSQGNYRLRRAQLPPRPRDHPLQRREPAQPAARHPCRGAGPGARRRESASKGTGLRPEITFTSTPPLPQDELLSRILFGTSITNLQRARGAAAGVGGRGAAIGLGQPRPDQRAAAGDRARPAADRLRRCRHRAEDRDRRGQVHHPQIVRRGDHRRPGLFRDPGRISDDALALDPVDGLDGRPGQRQRSGQQGLLEGSCASDIALR